MTSFCGLDSLASHTLEPIPASCLPASGADQSLYTPSAHLRLKHDLARAVSPHADQQTLPRENMLGEAALSEKEGGSERLEKQSAGFCGCMCASRREKGTCSKQRLDLLAHLDGLHACWVSPPRPHRPQQQLDADA